MKEVLYYIKDFKGTAIPVYTRPATYEDHLKTRHEHWQTLLCDIMARSLLNEFVKDGDFDGK